MSIDLIIVFIVLAFILVSLYTELLGTSFTFIIAIITLGVFGILTPSEILSGLSNQHVAVIIMLLLIGDIIKKTGIVEVVFDRVFRGINSKRSFLGRMMVIVSVFSAFLNNTPIVAIMMPYIHNWCIKKNMSPSKFLIPLSYAAILGGCATLIGTSTNLIVNGLLADQKIIPELQALQIFDFALIGVPMIVIGIIYMLFWGEKILPSKSDVYADYSSHARQYVVQAQVRANSFLIGKTIKEANLRDLKGIYLVELVRKNVKIPAVSPDVILEPGDILVFAGDTDRITDLLNTNSGLTLPEVGMMYKKKRTEIVEIVISQNSALVNKTVKEYNFRSRYDAAVISIHRNGERIGGKIGQVELKAGDVLLLYTGEDFYNRISNSQDFYLISKIRDFVKIENYKVIILTGGLFAAIILSAFNIISLFMGLMIVLLSTLAMRLTNPKELPRSIDYNVGIIIVLSLALGIAMKKSGAAELIANFFINLFIPLGKVGILFGIYFITTILAAYITNKAAVAIIFPISLTMASNLDLNPIPFVLIVAYASAANFLTPIGYQTNLMVYGPGKYSFNDFFRVGLPITLLYMIVAVTLLNLIYL